MEIYVYGLIFVFAIATCQLKGFDEDYIEFGSVKCTERGEICPVNATCRFACQYSCVNSYKRPNVHGTTVYSSTSSICKAALHDLRISIWDPNARNVTIKSYEKDKCFLESSVRFGFNSRTVQSESCKVFEFISPRISETILDVTSIHRNFLFEEYGIHEQYCLAASDAVNNSITFQTYSNWSKIEDKDTIYTAVMKDYVQTIKVWSESAIGGFQCIPSDTTLSIITSIAFRKNAWFYPDKFTVTVNKNDNVTLKMTEHNKAELKYKTIWKKDNRTLIAGNGTGRTELTLVNVHEASSGIYSLGYDSPEINDNRSGFIQLIVRTCPGGKYGPDCSVTCPLCLNGGICHDITGECICAPGFNGSRCETACEPGYIGKMCNIQCPAQGNSDESDACQGLLICLPSPYGCSCASGFKGNSCSNACADGYYGAGCIEHDSTSKCSKGWQGPYCNENKKMLRKRQYGNYDVNTRQSGKTNSLVSSPVVIPISRRSVKVSFTEYSSSKDLDSGNPARYGVQYKEYADRSWSYKPVTQNSCRNRKCQVEISNLQPGGDYLFGVMAIDGNNPQQEDGLRFTKYRLICDVANSPPTEIQMFSNNQMIHLKWKLPHRFDWNCWELRTLLRIKDIATSKVEQHIVRNTSYSFRSEPYATWLIEICTSPADDGSLYLLNCAERQVITADGPVLTESIPLDIINRPNAVFLMWKPPAQIVNEIYFYQIDYDNLKTGDSDYIQKLVSETTCEEKRRTHHCYEVKNLIGGHPYKIQITAFFRKNKRQGLVLKSVKVLVESPTNYVALVFGVFLPLVFATILVIWIMYRRKKQREAAARAKFLPYRASNDALDEMDIFETESICEEFSNRISVGDLAEYIVKSIQNNAIRKEFMCVPTGQIYPSSGAKMFENKPKNRYGNILPYDHSRVVLNSVKGDPFSNYINANYIHGYEKVKKYIATQGPLMCTVNDFWRMVWNEGTCKILMVTNFIESGRPKCEKYWTDNTCSYGEITVTLQNSKHYAEFVIRTFVILKGKTTRELKHFHFTTWPDHSAPPSATPFLNFLNKARSYRPDCEAPIVVHCSAGIGRTGTTILLDSMIDMGLRERHVDVVNHLCSMRKQRMNIVESLDQYLFVYYGLVEDLCIKDTSIKCSDFKKKFDKLKHIDNATKMTHIEKQFKILKTIPESSSRDVVSAYDSENQYKNRSMLILPPDRARPRLSSIDSSFYINAVYVDSFTRRNAFIATQYPLPETLRDFWSMVYELKSETVVILQDMKSSNEETPMLWLTECSQLFNGFQVECESTVTDNGLMFASILISSTNAEHVKEPLTVCVLVYQNWSVNCNLPEELPSFLSLISKVLLLQELKMHTITVVCSDGAVACGVFCAIMYICDQIKTEKVVDILRATKCIRINREQFISNVAQYRFLYDLVSAYLDSL